MLRALMLMFRLGATRRCAEDGTPDSAFGLMEAHEDTPHDQSPEALSARLDAVEAMLDDSQALYRLRAEANLTRLRRDPTPSKGQP